jgi:hypothetical protein
MPFRSSRRSKQEAAPVVPAREPVGVGERAGERAMMVSVMRASPDVRYRAARELGLLDGLENVVGVELERGLLERARASGVLAALEEAVAT